MTITAPAATCGENKFALELGMPANRLGCGERIETCAEVFRCTDCRTPFHHACALKHFGRDHVTAPLGPRVEDRARAEAVFKTWSLGTEPCLGALERTIREAREQGAHEARTPA